MGRRTHRDGFEITEERMFWEADPELLPFGEAATVASADGAPVPDLAPASAPLPEAPEPAHAIAPDGGPSPVAAQDPARTPTRLDDLSAALPPWALEPDWTDAPVTAPGRQWTRSLTLIGVAALAVILAGAVLRVATAPRGGRPARAQSAASVTTAGRRTPIALAEYRSRPRSPARNTTATAKPRRPKHRRTARPRRHRGGVVHRPRRAAHHPAAAAAAARAPVPVASSTPRVDTGATPAAHVAAPRSGVAPVQHSSSEFSFER